MGTLADSLFNVLMSWVRALVNSIWALFTTDHMTLLEFLGKNWVMLVVIMLCGGAGDGLAGMAGSLEALSSVGTPRAPLPASALS